MRDPKRIPALLETLRSEWEKHPDLRLGQLIVNAVTRHVGGQLSTSDIFYIEDDILLEHITKT
jgi:uncharacterized protein YihD (DUF1040 family)